jgi:hypothetical protein
MTVITEKDRAAEHLISEADHYHCRDEEIVAPGAGVTYEPGTVLAQVTASKKYVIWNPEGSGGAETVAAVLMIGVTGTADVPEAMRTIHTRGPVQLKKSKLKWISGATTNNINTGIAALEALGLVVREDV